MRSGVTVRVDWHGDEVLHTVEAAFMEGLRDYVGQVFELAQEWCPFDTGYLRSTGMIYEENGEIHIGYGASYAVYVHEHPEWHFKNGKRGKWLWLAIMETLGFAPETIAKHVRQVG